MKCRKKLAYHLMLILFAARKASLLMLWLFAFDTDRLRVHFREGALRCFICVKFYYLLVNEFVSRHKNANSAEKLSTPTIYSQKFLFLLERRF